MATEKEETEDTKNTGASYKPSPLYNAAEKKLAVFPSDRSDFKECNSERLFYELQVHQVELEIQAEELKRAHLALEESRDMYLDLYEFAPLGYLLLSDSAIISQANLTAATLFDVDRTSLISSRFRRWIATEDREIWDHFFLNLIHSEKKITATLMLKRGDGTAFPARLEGIRLTGSKDTHSIRIAISDISDIRQAEQALIKSKEGFLLQSRMLNAVGDAVIAVDKDHKIIFWNEAATRTYGWRPDEVIGKSTVEVTVPEISKKNAQRILELLDKGETWSGEYLVRHRDGHEFMVHVIDSPVFDDSGNLIAIIGASHDISEQMRANETLRNSQEQLLRAHELLEAVTKGTDVIIAVQDRDLSYIFFNQTYKDEIEKLTGKELTLGTRMVELFSHIPEEQERAIKEWSKVLAGTYVNQIIEFNSPWNKRKVYHVLHVPIEDAEGKIVGAGEVAFDVTKFVEIEEKLRETKEYLDNLITYANAPIIVWDPQFRITLFNQAFEHLTGRKANEVIGFPLEILLPEKYLTEGMELIKKTMEGERWESVEIPILHKMGEIRTVLWNSAAIFGSDGKTIVSTIAQGQDITDRKKIETECKRQAEEFAKTNIILSEEIKQREQSDAALNTTLSLLNASLESTADGILVVDNQNRITSYNQNFMSMWNIPRMILETENDITAIDYVLPQLKNPDDFLNNIQELKAHPARESYDMLEFVDGKIFERYSKPQLIGDKIVGRVWSFRDITDRKRAEEKLISSIQEKEILLREIHHRVKNNLQLISGLLDMTRMRSDNESTISILTDMMLKIQTMAQIHTRLYESQQFGKISLTDQINDQIIGLSNIFSTKGHKIECENNSQEVFLPVDQAIPCALVINEILSNAYKHAFKGRNNGKIVITALQENNHIRISIRDNGIGMPEHFDILYSSSLGLKLIRRLVESQLKGSVVINSPPGTEIVIQFPIMTEAIK